MKNLLFLLLILTCNSLLLAQNCDNLNQLKKGTRLVQQSYNGNDKKEGKSVSVVQEIKTEDGKKIWVMQTQSYSANDKLENEGEVELVCEGDVIYMDLSHMLKNPKFEEAGMEMEYENTRVEIPAELSVGKDIDNASIKINMSQEGKQVGSVEVLLTNRKVVNQESLTVPAGTYNAFVLEYDMIVSIEAMGMKLPGSTMKVKEYWAPGIGSVKNETYTDNDELLNYSVLSEFKK